MSAFLDESVKNVTTALKQGGYWDKLLLVFFSDNRCASPFRGLLCFISRCGVGHRPCIRRRRGNELSPKGGEDKSVEWRRAGQRVRRRRHDP